MEIPKLTTLYHIHIAYYADDKFSFVEINRFFDNLADACQHVLDLKDKGIIVDDIKSGTIRTEQLSKIMETTWM